MTRQIRPQTSAQGTGYIQGPLDGVALEHTAYALDRESRKVSPAHCLGRPDSRERGVENDRHCGHGAG
jgi:hypothetical protein